MKHFIALLNAILYCFTFVSLLYFINLNITVIENPGNDIFNYDFYQETDYLYKDLNGPINQSLMKFRTFVFIMLSINTFFYLFKTIFEISVGISKITNYLELCNLAFLTVGLVTKFAGIGLRTYTIDSAKNDNSD